MIFDHLFLYPWTRKLLDLHNNSLLKLFNYNCEIEYKLPVSSHVTSNDSERNYKFSLLLKASSRAIMIMMANFNLCSR